MLLALFRRAGGLAIATAIGQGCVLAVTPLLARWYSPAEFGTLALLMTVSNVSMVVACLRYDLALPSAPESEIRGLFVCCLIAAGLVAAAVLGVAELASMPMTGIPIALLSQHPVLIGGCVLLVGFYQATSAWLLRRGGYDRLAWLRIAQGGGFSLLALVPGVGLLWAHVLSFGSGLLAFRSLRLRRNSQEASWRDAARAHRDFPLLSLPGAILDVVGYSLCIWIIVAHYGRETAGNYSQVQRLIGAPLMLVSLSVGQILLRQTAELAGSSSALKNFLTRVFLVMAGLAVVGLSALWFIGEPLFRLVLGAQWNVERMMIILVGVAVFVRACVSPMSVVLLTLRRFRSALFWQALYFASAVLLMPFMASKLSFSGFLAFYAAHECVLYGVYLVLIFRSVNCESKPSDLKCAAS